MLPKKTHCGTVQCRFHALSDFFLRSSRHFLFIVPPKFSGFLFIFEMNRCLANPCPPKLDSSSDHRDISGFRHPLGSSLPVFSSYWHRGNVQGFPLLVENLGKQFTLSLKNKKQHENTTNEQKKKKKKCGLRIDWHDVLLFQFFFRQGFYRIFFFFIPNTHTHTHTHTRGSPFPLSWLPAFIFTNVHVIRKFDCIGCGCGTWSFNDVDR